MTTSKKRAAVYARFSSDLQKDRSIDDQIAVCRQYAGRENLTIKAEFSDRAKSGASLFDREGLYTLMKEAKAGAFDAVVVESLDRLSRDTEDLAGLYKRLQFYGVEIHTINEGVATSIHVGIRGIVGSLYLADLGHKIRRGQDGQVREGKIPGAVAFGYRLVEGKTCERAIDEAQAETVRRVFREYAEGRSPRAIAKALTAEGIKGPRGKSVWAPFNISGGTQGLITNQIYIGKITWNAKRSILDPDKGRRVKRTGNPQDLLVVDAPHLRIVDQKLWDAAQAVREGRAYAKFGPGGKVKGSVRKHLAYAEHLLTGLLKCAKCGGNMSLSSRTREGHARVKCANALVHMTCDHTKSYCLPNLERGVIDGLKAQLTDPEAIALAAKEYHAQWAKESRKARAELDQDRQRLQRIEIQIERIVDAIVNGGDPVKALSEKLRKLEVERVALTERLRLKETETNVVDLHPGALQSYRDSVEKLHRVLTTESHTAEARAALRNLIDCIVVQPTPKRAPYAFDVFGRLSAIMGVDLFPFQRSPEKIVEEQGIPAVATVSCKDVPTRQDRNIVHLGRWRCAA